MKSQTLLVLFSAALCFGQRYEVKLDPATSKIKYEVNTTLHTVHGTFKLKNGNLWFDTTTGAAGGQLVVDAASGDSGSGSRDSRMNKVVLESAKFAEITFVPDKVEGKVNLAGDSTVTLHGALTIHGSKHELAMSVKSQIAASRLTADIGFAVPYVDWGMKNPGNFMLKVDPSVRIDIQAAGQIEPAH